MKTVILGGGLAGLSASYYLGHEDCIVYEKNDFLGGHIHSENVNEFTWDEGPHVSFTKWDEVIEIFEKGVEGDYLEYPVKTANYYKGNWIPHPAQSNMFAIPLELREKCLTDFLNTRESIEKNKKPSDYGEWLSFAFGDTFSKNFPSIYTEKYWTTEPKNLTTDWVGERVFYPNVDQVKEGYIKPLEEETHYIKTIRYPNKGGYFSFAKEIAKNVNAKLNHEVVKIDLDNKAIYFSNGEKTNYEQLINTLPLPIFIKLCNAPSEILKEVEKLNCSSVLLVNVMANHKTKREENWIYVYDKDKYSTRINCTELLSPNNAPTGKTGVQVEVYFSDYKPYDPKLKDEIEKKVCDELIEMGLIESNESIENMYTKYVDWANIIFDKQRLQAQDKVLNYLTQFGLKRENDDMKPTSRWDEKLSENEKLGSLILAGRFGQWKYLWSDDCVMRGKYIAEKIK